MTLAGVQGERDAQVTGTRQPAHLLVVDGDSIKRHGRDLQ
jgi:hypothetical protein